MVHSLGWSHFLLIVIVAVGLIFSWDFGRRIVENMQLMQEIKIAERELAVQEQTHATLVALKARTKSPEWIEEQARRRFHYAKPDETIIIPAATPPAPAKSVPVEVPPPPERTIWQDVLETLFGPAQ